MANDINKIIFSRTAPAKKVEIVKGLSMAELLAVSLDTIKRIIKEVAPSRYKSRDREMRIERTGNGWNSEIESVGLYKGQPTIFFYLQYENTDTSTLDYFTNFLKRGDYRGQTVRDDRYGNPRTYYFTYNEQNKACVVKSVLLEYLHRKYADKL